MTLPRKQCNVWPSLSLWNLGALKFSETPLSCYKTRPKTPGRDPLTLHGFRLNFSFLAVLEVLYPVSQSVSHWPKAVTRPQCKHTLQSSIVTITLLKNIWQGSPSQWVTTCKTMLAGQKRQIRYFAGDKSSVKGKRSPWPALVFAKWRSCARLA